VIDQTVGAAACNGAYEFETDLLSSAHERERIFVILGLAEGLISER